MHRIKITKKCVLIGDGGVGKSSLVRRFVTGYFNPIYQVTLGTTIMKKVVHHYDSIVTLSIWDIGGQTVFKQVRSKYYFASEGALAICDVTNRTSYENLFSWIESYREVVGDKPLIIVGNKIDLDKRVIFDEDIEAMQKQFSNSRFIYTSAKEGENVEAAFKLLVELQLREEELDI